MKFLALSFYSKLDSNQKTFYGGEKVPAGFVEKDYKLVYNNVNINFQIIISLFEINT